MRVYRLRICCILRSPPGEKSGEVAVEVLQEAVHIKHVVRADHAGANKFGSLSHSEVCYRPGRLLLPDRRCNERLIVTRGAQDVEEPHVIAAADDFDIVQAIAFSTHSAFDLGHQSPDYVFIHGAEHQSGFLPAEVINVQSVDKVIEG